jgi:23S rRNA (cytosine1962-C5)-methyltransferase
MTDREAGFAAWLEAAASRRLALLERLRREGTDAWRVLHGATEGVPGVAVDRYGALTLVQLFRAAGESFPLDAFVAALRARGDATEALVVVDRRAGPARVAVLGDDAEREFPVHEAGMQALVRARHQGQDPWLFLDLRAGRRALRALAPTRRVLNLFAYTCTAGIAAALAGAREVWNVDFSAGWLHIGERLAALNGVADRCRFLREDCFAVLRQLAGLPVQRRGKGPAFTKLAPQTFDLVVLDPPRLATGPFGKVDLVADYQSLFKPAWLATADGGALLATNNVAAVEREAWLALLRRCAEKAGRPIGTLESIEPDADFPTPDGKAPLKIALCRP